jgi:hypothetical protein
VGKMSLPEKSETPNPKWENFQRGGWVPVPRLARHPVDGESTGGHPERIFEIYLNMSHHFPIFTEKLMQLSKGKWIPGYEGHYMVHPNGDIESMKQSQTGWECDSYNTLTPWKHKNKSDGYLRVKLTKDKKRKNYFIHRLVAYLFVPNPLNLTEVNHKDGNKQNNNDWNLEWTDRPSNMIHSYRVLGNKSKGRSYPQCKLK